MRYGYRSVLVLVGILVLLLCHVKGYSCYGDSESEANGRKLPTILIVTLIRNKAHTLPYFFSYLDRLDYPKDRIAFWIRSDHNADKSVELIQLWREQVQHLYHHIDFEFNAEEESGDRRRPNETSQFHWPESRFRAVMEMKELGLAHARHMWADYVFLLDADVFLTNRHTLHTLIRENVTLVSPMLQSDGMYSNYWCGMSKEYYYQRTDEYKQILDREKIGAFAVPMVHSAILIDLNRVESDQLTYDRDRLGADYDGPLDDIIVMAMSANYSNIPMHISNTDHYGYIMSPLDAEDQLAKDLEQLVNVKLLIINDLLEIHSMPVFDKYTTRPPMDRMSLSKVYMINLWRRVERREKMERAFRELGLQVDHFPAVDGKQMDEAYLQSLDIRFLPGYADPYSKRPMTMGEIGCFLSHYFIWQQMLEDGHQEVLVLEDDIKFEPYFRQRLATVLAETRALPGGWDLVYLGRKRLHESEEPWVEDTSYLVRPSYSYWTLGYMISEQGARKLLATQPLQKLIPVDEFLPIMFDRHPNEEWKEAFPARDLRAFSAAPLLLFPTHYTGEVGYISDTEDSIVIPGTANNSNSNNNSNNGSQNEGAAAEEVPTLASKSAMTSSLNKNHISHEL